MNRTTLPFSMVSYRRHWVLWSSLVLLAPIGCDRDETKDPTVRGREGTSIGTFEHRSEVPKCNSSTFGGVYYVEEEESFFYCDGKELRVIEIAGSPGQEGLAWLVSLTTAPSEQCPAGGALILVGPDNDRDGQLDSQEIAATAIVCNGGDGADGNDGEDGINALVRQSAEPPGEACVNGGVRIDSGRDLDRDDALDPEEIEASSYVCFPESGDDGGSGGQGGGDSTTAQCGDNVLTDGEFCCTPDWVEDRVQSTVASMETELPGTTTCHPASTVGSGLGEIVLCDTGACEGGAIGCRGEIVDIDTTYDSKTEQMAATLDFTFNGVASSLVGSCSFTVTIKGLQVLARAAPETTAESSTVRFTQIQTGHYEDLSVTGCSVLGDAMEIILAFTQPAITGAVRTALGAHEREYTCPY
jgi:hypothetical protein